MLHFLKMFLKSISSHSESFWKKQAPPGHGSDWMPSKCFCAWLLPCQLTCSLALFAFLPASCLPACLLTCLLACLPACLLTTCLLCLPSCLLLACLLAYLLAYMLACLPACMLACLPACLLALGLFRMLLELIIWGLCLTHDILTPWAPVGAKKLISPSWL